MEYAVFAGGCFWCTEAVFLKLKGVIEVKSGFTGGHIKNPAYKEVVTERTGHAEAIHITFDPTVISYFKLLEIFFATHDPTTLNGQGADKGTHYRSAIFYTSDLQKKNSLEFIDLLNNENVFENDIVTEVKAFTVFYSAEDYHTNYYNLNNEQPYCKYVIEPKIKKLVNYFSENLK